MRCVGLAQFLTIQLAPTVLSRPFHFIDRQRVKIMTRQQADIFRPAAVEDASEHEGTGRLENDVVAMVVRWVVLSQLIRDCAK